MKSKQNFSTKIAKTFKSTESKLLLIAFLVITGLFWGLRLNNFENMMTFHIDQADHILEIKEMVDQHKLRLIGPIVSTRIREGKGYFIGPHYYYILAGLGIVTGWNIILMTKLLLLMWWGTALAMLYWIGKKLNWSVALIIYFLFAVHPYLVGYSHMFLNPNFAAPVSVAFFYFLYQAWRRNKATDWLITGILAGVGLSFHFVVGLWIVISGLTWLVSLIRRKAKWWYVFLLGGGVLIGDLPYVIFELRHNFYNIRTFLSIGAAPEGTGLTAGYYLFAYLPVILWGLALAFEFLRKRTHLLVPILVAVLMVIYSYHTYDQPKVRGIGMPKGWSIPLQQQLAQRICDDSKKGKFELAALITADLRALDLRWWVMQCGAKPEGYTQYPYVDTLYIVDQGSLAKGEYPANWETASIGPHVVTVQEQLNEYLWFYKVERTEDTHSPLSITK